MLSEHIHRPAHALQLDDALYRVRGALSALHSIDVRTLSADEHQRLSRIASQLADAIEALEARRA